MDDVAQLEAIAAQLVARLRDDEPDANDRWLQANTTPADRHALLYILAAAVPTDRPWRQLVAWTQQVEPYEERRRRYQREWQRRHRAAEVGYGAA